VSSLAQPVQAAESWAAAGVQPAARRGRSIDRLAQWLGGHAERWYLLFLMLQMSGANLYPRSVNTRSVTISEESLTDSIFVFLYLILGALLVMRLKGVVRAALAHWWTILLVVTVAASVLWSQDPQITIHRTFKILVTCSVGWYLVARYPPREIFQLLAITLVFTALLSAFYGTLDPGVASGIAWQGVYEHRNVFARSMVLSAIACLLLLLEPTRWRWLLWAGFALSCAMVGLSQSATGAIALTVLIVLVWFSGSLRLRATILIPLLIGCALLLVGGVAWLQQHAADVAQYVGRETTLTGRTELWAVAIMMIQRHPWLGYGFGGFWRGPIGDSGEFWRAVRWNAPHAHNGYIDLTLDLGLLGLAIFVAGLAIALIAAVSRARSARTTSAVAPLVVLAFLVIYNLTESSVLRHNTLYLVLYAAATSMARGGSERSVVRPGSQRERHRATYRLRSGS